MREFVIQGRSKEIRVFLGGYECKGISLRYSAHLVDDLQSMSTKIPTMSQYSATETAFVSCSLSAFLSVDLKKKKFCGYIFVFCSKEFLRWGESVNQQTGRPA